MSARSELIYAGAVNASGVLPNDRLARIFANAPEELDAVVVLNGTLPDPNFFYISGYRSGLFEGNMLFLFRDRHVEVLTNPLEEAAARARKDYVVHVETDRGQSERKRTVARILRDSKRVGVNFLGVSHGDYQELASILSTKKVFDVAAALRASRLVKDPDELEAISKSAEIISGVVEEVPEILEEGMTERSLKAAIDYRMVEAGADSPSFESIVAFGENSSLPHYSSGDRRLKKGDNVLVDVGARYRLYCSDITRTFFFGTAPPAQKEAYTTVLHAQERAIKATRAGITGSAVHQVAARVIDASRFKGRFTHGLGHSLGIEVHDGPGLSRGSDLMLKENMVMTVEPGVYLQGQGGVRIEDDVVVGKGSCRVLTTCSKDLVEV